MILCVVVLSSLLSWLHSAPCGIGVSDVKAGVIKHSSLKVPQGHLLRFVIAYSQVIQVIDNVNVFVSPRKPR